MRPFHVVAELTTGQPERFAVLSIDPTKRKDLGCEGTILSLHQTEAGAIAASLTDSQREALIEADILVDGRVLVSASSFVGSLWPSSLVRYYSARCDALSTLGLRVRDHLIEGGLR